jgi:hypothetical protein
MTDYGSVIGTEKTMVAAASDLLAALRPENARAARFPFGAPARAQWSYLPGARRGAELAALGATGRKAAHRLLATALSRPAFAQAVTIMAFEELLDLDERGALGRHSDGYYVAVFGEPGTEPWGWRFEGHHLSVNVTVAAGRPVVAPLFLGSNPARVDRDGELVLAPLRVEEDLARDLVTGLPGALRARAVVAGTAPDDIVTAMAESVDGSLAPAGIAAANLPGPARDLLSRLLRVYTSRLAPAVADGLQAHERPAGDGVFFAWAGGLAPGDGHYYRIQTPGLLIEYDNTQREANHAHTVLRMPGGDFGGGLLAGHLAAERQAPARLHSPHARSPPAQPAGRAADRRAGTAAGRRPTRGPDDGPPAAHPPAARPHERHRAER